MLSPLLFLASIAQAEEGLQRIALVAGTNDGGSERVALRYAETDAQSMASVLHDLGGVSRDNIVLLLGPTKADSRSRLRAAEREDPRGRRTHGSDHLLLGSLRRGRSPAR